MDRPGRVLRGRANISDAPETVGSTTRRSTLKTTTTSVATAGSAAGGRRTVSAAGKKTDSSRSKGNVSPSRTRTSPSRKRTSPVRRSSRPRSTIPTVEVEPTVKVSKLSPTKEEDETTGMRKKTNLPTTLTTNTSSNAPNRVTTTSSTHSSYSSVTQKTVEIRTTNDPSDITKLAEFIRRSVSKTFSHSGGGTEDREGSVTPSQKTDGGSRYSRSLSRSVYDNDDDRYSKAEFSDTDTNDQDDDIYEEDGNIDIEPYKAFARASLARGTSMCRKLPVPKEFGGWMGALILMLTVPCVVYYLQWCCSRESCEFKMPNYKDIQDIYAWGPKLFDLETVSVFVAFNMGVFILSAVLFGRSVRIPGCPEHKFNVLPIAALVAAAYAGAVYYKYPVADFILNNYHRLAVYGLLNAYVLGLWAYFRADILKQKEYQSNVYAKSGNFVVDYALGRQLNPKWLDLVDFKLVFYRMSLLSVFLYALSLLYKNIETPLIPKDVEGVDNIIPFFFKNLKYDTTSLICSFMVLLYILDSIVFEHHLASSFEMQGEGFGCLLLLRYAATPVLLTSVAKYFYEYRTPILCQCALYIPVVMLLAGLILKRYSNAIKYKYRIQPNHPLFYDMETIHTFQGRRLLLGALWGQLRQPNYLGDIICLGALALPLAMRFAWPPLVSLLLIVVILVHRCFRVNDRNTARYHSSWVRYRSIARSILIPKIF